MSYPELAHGHDPRRSDSVECWAVVRHDSFRWKDGQIIARGQNRVLLTGCITAHGEVIAIQQAVLALNPFASAIAVSEQNESPWLVARSQVLPDPVAARSVMLMGTEHYTIGFPVICA